MILRFMTKRNKTYGYRKYLAIDTDKKVFCTLSPRMIPEGEEIPATALKNIRKTCETNGYKETGAF